MSVNPGFLGREELRLQGRLGEREGVFSALWNKKTVLRKAAVLKVGWRRYKVWSGEEGWKREKGWRKDGVEDRGMEGIRGFASQLQAASTAPVNVGSSPSCFSSLVPAPWKEVVIPTPAPAVVCSINRTLGKSLLLWPLWGCSPALRVRSPRGCLTEQMLPSSPKTRRKGCVCPVLRG